jgi:amino acid adenylation domain-containing protein
MSWLLHERIRAVALASPEAAAVQSDTEEWTYARLEGESNRLARALLEEGVEPGARVALFAEKGPHAVAAMLAALETGALHVPIDLTSPAARVHKILNAAQPALCLADEAGLPLMNAAFERGTRSRVGLLAPAGDGAADFTAADTATLSSAPIGRRAEPSEGVHLLFTSGSTGEPKGVVITHSNIAAFLDWAIPHFGLGPGDRISGHSPLHFDLSSFDIYGALCSGSAVVLVPSRLNLLPRELARFIDARQLTQWFSVPSVLTLLAQFDAFPEGGFPTLQRVLWCGDVLPTPTLIFWMRRLPHVAFTNLYGPTEATIASSFHPVLDLPKDPREPVPIGLACDGEELVVMEEGSTCPAHEVGDLYIGGAGLSPGYWADPEQTAAVFVDDPRPGRHGERLYRTGDLAFRDDTGIHHFVGRADTQIKSRGYRIELGEIEAALNALGPVESVAVVAIEASGFEGKTICCAYTARNSHVAAADLRQALRDLLPPYMLPTRWEKLDALPLNPNGKVDRRQIAALFLPPRTG